MTKGWGPINRMATMFYLLNHNEASQELIYWPSKHIQLGILNISSNLNDVLKLRHWVVYWKENWRNRSYNLHGKKHLSNQSTELAWWQNCVGKNISERGTMEKWSFVASDNFPGQFQQPTKCFNTVNYEEMLTLSIHEIHIYPFALYPWSH